MKGTRGGARKGAGPKKVIDANRNLNIRIPEAELEAAQAAAAEQGYVGRFSEWVREAMRRML